MDLRVNVQDLDQDKRRERNHDYVGKTVAEHEQTKHEYCRALVD